MNFKKYNEMELMMLASIATMSEEEFTALVQTATQAAESLSQMFG